MSDPDRLHELSADWNAIDAELEALWLAHDKPRGKAWQELVAPVWERQTAIEVELGPLLLGWAESNECGKLTLRGWMAAPNSYGKIKEHSGLDAPGNRFVGC